MPRPLMVPPLTGDLVRLVPLDGSYADALADAAAERRDTYGFTAVPATLEESQSYIAERLELAANGDMVPFVQVDRAASRVVGVTTYLNLRRRRSDETSPYAVEIGNTWLAESAQRTGINVEAKLLLLTHAFDTWQVGRVDLKTDARNERSRAAIAALGASFEGILRAWQPSQVRGEPGLRDTAMYSIVAAEWAAVRDRLRSRLERGAAMPSR